MSNEFPNSGDIYLQLGRLDGRVTAVENDMRKIDSRLEGIEQTLGEMKELLAQGKGGWVMLAWIGGVLGSLAGLAAWVYKLIDRP